MAVTATNKNGISFDVHAFADAMSRLGVSAREAGNAMQALGRVTRIEHKKPFRDVVLSEGIKMAYPTDHSEIVLHGDNGHWTISSPRQPTPEDFPPPPDRKFKTHRAIDLET